MKRKETFWAIVAGVMVAASCVRSGRRLAEEELVEARAVADLTLPGESPSPATSAGSLSSSSAESPDAETATAAALPSPAGPAVLSLALRDHAAPRGSGTCARCQDGICLGTTCVTPGDIILDGSIGIGPGQFMVDPGNEAQRMGPASIAGSADATTLYVLDHLSRRIQKFVNGAHRRTIPLTGRCCADDLASLPGQRLVVLYHQQNRAVVIDENGKELSSVFANRRSANRLMVASNGVWLADYQQLVVKVADETGMTPTPRASHRGLLSFDTTWLYRVESQKDKTLLFTRWSAAEDSNPERRVLRDPEGPRGVETTETDASGNFYVFAAWGDYRVSKPIRAAVLSPELEVLRAFDLAQPTGGYDADKRITVTAGGIVLQLDSTEDRIRVRAY